MGVSFSSQHQKRIVSTANFCETDTPLNVHSSTREFEFLSIEELFDSITPHCTYETLYDSLYYELSPRHFNATVSFHQRVYLVIWTTDEIFGCYIPHINSPPRSRLVNKSRSSQPFFFFSIKNPHNKIFSFKIENNQTSLLLFNNAELSFVCTVFNCFSIKTSNEITLNFGHGFSDIHSKFTDEHLHCTLYLKRLLVFNAVN
ncbi:hypothetical protein EIN_059370 [Entamoeba invadens IP1]|uniref:hypothetical protein n=1 Tax=Entamoeba invadens IP1 TaxID=370355 RepID=UPI0002C3E0AD|nr:hypothetical protein EIN_059370 [Entamoeba invadens IP1]ELP93452.1 hypothetical protein EIN_059370 [Entamoeba invadens IP1]|eukprot:XP_004260223.1 hypothetical protein EIN_059370 [Entamoeba invadens IP1]